MQKIRLIVILILVCVVIVISSLFYFNMREETNGNIIIAKQGSFTIGGSVITNEQGKTHHGDHAYVFYQ